MPSKTKYLVTITSSFVSLLAGAAFVHNVYQPSQQLPIEGLLAQARAREEKAKSTNTK
jgi:hypothetical protein